MDAGLMRLVDGALAIPRLFILLLVLATMERVPLPALIVLIGATGWFATSRLVRAEVLRIREETYVRAAEALGAGGATLSCGIFSPTQWDLCWWQRRSALAM